MKKKIETSKYLDDVESLLFHGVNCSINKLVSSIRLIRSMDDSVFVHSLTWCEYFTSHRPEGDLNNAINTVLTFVSVAAAELERADIDEIIYQHKCSGNISKEIFEEMIDYANITIDEIIKRNRNLKWEYLSSLDVIINLRKFLNLMAKTSKFGIIFKNDIHHKEDEYIVEITVKGSGGMLEAPIGAVDTFRELIENGIKYSNPGSRVIADMINEDEKLKMTVFDIGRGIPHGEIDFVPINRHRASNVQDVYGEGYGLTKACLFCHENNGDMWIESIIDEGTTISLEIPYP